ncbi:MAG: PhzF family phenazine biosynthesis protein [Burkholderiales bacterium]|nr:PhzF family phenazine biosynthesis protein [Burkholderiales bacterium]
MTRSVDVRIVTAFVKDGQGGNPAGVVLDADAMTAAQKQAVARLVGLPETAFVSRSSVASVKLEFFTPTRQIAHCGHATIAAFSLLRQLGHLDGNAASKETIDGLRNITLDGDQAFMAQTAPVVEALPPGIAPGDVARSLGLAAAELNDACVVSTGNRFLLVDVATPQRLAGLAPDMAAITRISDALDLIGVYAYVVTPDGLARATTRMFAPRYGIAEESGTGMAAGPLGCLLWQQGQVRDTAFELEQGRFMNPPSVSRLRVRLDIADQRITGLAVGGSARVMSSRSLEV